MYCGEMCDIKLPVAELFLTPNLLTLLLLLGPLHLGPQLVQVGGQLPLEIDLHLKFPAYSTLSLIMGRGPSFFSWRRDGTRFSANRIWG